MSYNGLKDPDDWSTPDMADRCLCETYDKCLAHLHLCPLLTPRTPRQMTQYLTARLHIGEVVTTIHGNKLRRFEDGWSPLVAGHWDRWTVYTDDELAANFTLARAT